MRIPVSLPKLLPILAAFALNCALSAAEPLVLSADFSKPNGTIKAIHGVNKGPLAPGGLVNLSKDTAALGLPSTRLHDCHWPTPDVVDFHAVFPNFDADPTKPESYDFRLTDLYIDAILKTGSKIVYRLGQSIEHTKVKRFVHPPKDMAKWSEISIGIIRHYNEGWAEGTKHDIQYWEIWNEPENRPVMWSGTDDDYYRLYSTAAKAIKARYPALKVGGPGIGASGEFKDGELKPTEFLTNFLEMCRRDSLPLDFFSWHCYSADPAEMSGRARAVRKLLDSYGFTKAESHLNEWNYLPGNQWEMGMKPEEKERHFAEMCGAGGAAFVTTTLLELQDTPIDLTNFFHGEIGAMGLFSEHGRPQKNYYGFLAFKHLIDHPQRVEMKGAVSGKLAAVSGLNSAKTEAVVLVSNFSSTQEEIKVNLAGLPWTGDTIREVRIVDATRNLEPQKPITAPASTPLSLTLKAPAVALVTLRPAK